jgi:hypothetical protein
MPISNEVFDQFGFKFKARVIATNMNSHALILSRRFGDRVKTLQSKTRPADFSTERV